MCKETPQPPFSTPAAQGWFARLFAALVLGLMPTQPIWPTSGEVRQPSPPLLLPTLSPFTKLLIAIHKEVLASTFRHLYLLAGKLQDFIGPGRDIQTSKGILCESVFGRGGTRFGAQKVNAARGLQILHRTPRHVAAYGSRTANLLLDLAESGQGA